MRPQITSTILFFGLAYSSVGGRLNYLETLVSLLEKMECKFSLFVCFT